MILRSELVWLRCAPPQSLPVLCFHLESHSWQTSSLLNFSAWGMEITVFVHLTLFLKKKHFYDLLLPKSKPNWEGQLSTVTDWTKTCSNVNHWTLLNLCWIQDVCVQVFLSDYVTVLLCDLPLLLCVAAILGQVISCKRHPQSLSNTDDNNLTITNFIREK